MSYLSTSQRNNEPWRNKERHHCAVCNSWMGSDRQSILIHENGKRHLEKVEESLKQRRLEKTQKEKAQNYLESSLKKMNEFAKQNTACLVNGKSDHAIVETGSINRDQLKLHAGNNTSKTVEKKVEKAVIDSMKLNVPHAADKVNEMASWEDRKSKRQSETSTTTSVEEECVHGKDQNRKSTRQKLEAGEGHYIDESGNTYLEGAIYSQILEDEMVIEIWTGSTTMTDDFKKSKDANNIWKTGIVVRVDKSKIKVGDNNTEEETITCNVSYLMNPDDDDETIEEKVKPERIRLKLGSDDIVPQTIEEARLALLGGEEIIKMNCNDSIKIDENTGLTGWGTVSVTKTTVNHELKRERLLRRSIKRKEEETDKRKEMEEKNRMLEETMHANGDDSALGAYDFWSNGGNKEGYKGVNINEDNMDVNDTAKRLTKGKKVVAFKKQKGKTIGGLKTHKHQKKKIRRKTLADDD